MSNTHIRTALFLFVLFQHYLPLTISLSRWPSAPLDIIFHAMLGSPMAGKVATPVYASHEDLATVVLPWCSLELSWCQHFSTVKIWPLLLTTRPFYG